MDGFVVSSVHGLPKGEFAYFSEREGGLPVRAIVTGRRSRRTGAYFSVKCGYAVPWESGNELRAIYDAEVRTDVVRYRVQPHTLHLGDGKGVRQYTPDLELQLIDGTIEIVEVKGRFIEDADPQYSEKLNAARKVYAITGHKFRVIEYDQCRDAQSKAVDEVQAYRRVVITPGDTIAIAELFRTEDQLPLGCISLGSGNGIVDRAKLCAMMVRRIVDIDLSKGLRADSMVRLIRSKEPINV
jgi:hypothetical protein